MISRKLLCAATLVCLAPFAASAAEAHLSPNKNDGSGAMPSGYSTLFFDMRNGDYAADVKLPANPRSGDYVILSSEAQLSARLDAAHTSVADLVYIPVDSLSSYALISSDIAGRWLALGRGLNETRIVLNNGPHAQIPKTDKTFVDANVTGPVTSVSLPASAPRGAVLGLSNYTQADVTVKGPELAGQPDTCAPEKSCAFVFDGSDSKWHPRRGRAYFQPTTEQLPKLEQRWTDIVTSGPAQDVVTPRNIKLPLDAIDGDIVALTDLSDSRFYRAEGRILGSKPILFRYDSGTAGWVLQSR